MSPPTIQELAARFSVIPVGLDKRPHGKLLVRSGAFALVDSNGQRLQKAVWKPFQQRRASKQELAIWVAGASSGPFTEQEPLSPESPALHGPVARGGKGAESSLPSLCTPST